MSKLNSRKAKNRKVPQAVKRRKPWPLGFEKGDAVSYSSVGEPNRRKAKFIKYDKGEAVVEYKGIQSRVPNSLLNPVYNNPNEIKKYTPTTEEDRILGQIISKMIEQGAKDVSDEEIDRALKGTVAYPGTVKFAKEMRDKGRLKKSDLKES